MIELQIVQGVLHRGRELRGVGTFDFEAKTLLTPNDKQVELGASVGAPEEAPVGMSAKLSDALLQIDPFWAENTCFAKVVLPT